MRTMLSFGAAAVLGLVLGLAGCGSTETAAKNNTSALRAATGEAEVVLVEMWAEWCGACQRLDPQVAAAVEQMGDRPVRLVKADLTDRNGPAAEATLREMGLGGLYEKNSGKTGVVYIVNADTGEVMGEISGTRVTSAEIVARVSEALEAATG